jgi:hypothetical protein
VGPGWLKRALLILFLPLAISAFAQEEDTANGETEAPGESTAGFLDTAALRQAYLNEANPALAAINVNDTDVSLFLSGFWKGSLTAKWGLSKGPLGFGVASNDSPILFTQEADLNLGLWIKERWFVEAAFEEDYHINTYRAGYQGKDGELVQYLGVGNRGLDFPEFPYLDLGGDSASSFGLYGRFGSGPLQFHTLVRWDDAVREERTFVGGRERSYSYLPPASSLRGISFVLPDDNIPSEVKVYFEDKDGPLSDGSGRRWRLALPSEYASSARFGVVELGTSPDVRVAVSYAGNYASSMGSYSSPGTFLGDVGLLFSEVDLSQYPQPGQESAGGAPAIITIGGVSSLVIYEKGTFSPFERQSRYDAPSSNTETAALVDASSGERISGYDVTPLSGMTAYPDLPLYVQEETGETMIRERKIFELTRTDIRVEIRDPQSRWPLALDTAGKPWNYQVYLPGNEGYSSDVRIRFANYGSASGYSIGTDVVPGSVQVLRAGIDDPNFSFDPSSGLVQLQNPATFNETIRVSYLRRSSERRNGSLAIGFGTVYTQDEHFSAQGALGLRWNLAAESFSEEGATSPGTVGLGSKAEWDYDSVKADFKFGLGFEQPDTTGLYRVAGMEGNEHTLPLSETGSFISETPRDTDLITGLTPGGRAPLSYRNYRKVDPLGGSKLMNYDWDGAEVISGKDGPYPVHDDALGSDVLAAEFTLGGDKNWTGFQSPLGDGNELSEARTIEVPFQFNNFGFGVSDAFKVIVQFGDLADKNRAGYENPMLILEKELFPASGITFGDQPQIFSITLNDGDRRKLTNAKYLRLVIINVGTGEISGRIFLAPPIVRGAKFAPLVKQGDSLLPNQDEVTTIEVPDPSLRDRYPDIINRLHPDGERQRVLAVTWESMQADQSPGSGGRVGVIPFADYKTLSFFVKGPYPGSGSLDFIVARGQSSLGKASETALRVSIPTSELKRVSGGNWTKVELRYGGGKNEVYAGGQKIGVPLSYNPDALKNRASDDGDWESGSAYIMVFMNGAGSNGSSFGLDEIILEEGAPAYWLNSGGSFNWRRNETIVELNGVKVLESPVFETVIETSARGDPWTAGSENFFGVINRSSAGIRLFGILLEGNTAFSTGTDRLWWNAGHGISRAIGPVSLRERFFVDPYGKKWMHEAGIALNSLVHGDFKAKSELNSEKKTRLWQAGFGMNNIPQTPLGFSLTADGRWSQNEWGETDDYTNYGLVWTDTWNELVPDDGSAAESRLLHGRFETALGSRPLGFNLSLDARSAAARSSNNTESAADAILGFPFSVGQLSGSFGIERGYRRQLLFSGGNAGDDLQKFGETFAEGAAVYASIPFYSLFDPGLPDGLGETLKKSASSSLIQNAYFIDKYRLGLQFPESFGLSSLFLPRGLDAHIDRSLNQKYDTMLDTLGTGGTLRFSAMNMFGAFGAKPLFKFYENDEFNTSLGAAIAAPKGEAPSWRLQADQLFVFYGFLGAELQFEDVLTLLSSGWTAAFKLDWTSPAEKSLLGTFYSWVFSRFRDNSEWPALNELANSGFERLRRETLELNFDESNSDAGRFSFAFEHRSIVRVLGRLNLDVFARLDIDHSAQTETTTFTATFGTNLNVSY